MEKAIPWRAVACSDASAANSAIWAARDHRYGGLASRYKKDHRRLIRIMDPFTMTPMQFSTTLRADNWLLRNFCPGATRCHVPAGGLRYLQEGKVRSVHCDLITEFRDGVQVADLVVTLREERGCESTWWWELKQVAVAFDVVPQLRREHEIRANPTLLTNLDRMCQHLVLHDRDDLHQQDQIRAAIPSSGTIRVAELHNELRYSRSPLPTPEQFDSALFRLYRLGAVSVNIAEVSYGPSSTVSHA